MYFVFHSPAQDLHISAFEKASLPWRSGGLPCAYFVHVEMAQMAKIAKMAQIRSDLIDLALGGGWASNAKQREQRALKGI